MNKLLLSLLATASPLAAQTITYDFNSQWNNDWITYHVQTGGTAYTPSMNYSKSHEGRLGGAGGNELGGTVSAPAGYTGAITSIYEGRPVDSINTIGNKLRLQGSYSAFANQDKFKTGTSEAGQVGLINAGATDASKTLKHGDSVYLGFVEKSWTGQNVSAPFAGTAEVEIGLYADGVKQVTFGTFTVNDYGARVSSDIYGQWFEYDILFENLADGSLGYKVGVNTVSYFYDGSINEGAPNSLGIWQGSLASGGGLNDLSSLRAAYGANVVDTNVSITGYTFDHSSGDIHDGVIVVPEPSSTLLLGVSAIGFFLRRRR